IVLGSHKKHPEFIDDDYDENEKKKKDEKKDDDNDDDVNDDHTDHNLLKVIVKSIMKERDTFQDTVLVLISKEFADHAPKLIEELFQSYIQNNVITVHPITSSSTAASSSANLQQQILFATMITMTIKKMMLLLRGRKKQKYKRNQRVQSLQEVIHQNNQQAVMYLNVNNNNNKTGMLRFNHKLLIKMRSCVIWERVHGFQLGIESYQIRINLTAPALIFTGIATRDPFSIVDKPTTGLIYLNNKEKKRVIYLVEIMKFCDATLERVLKEVKLKIFETEFWKKPPFLGDLDLDIMKAYEREITKRLRHRQQMRRFTDDPNKKYVKGDIAFVDMIDNARFKLDLLNLVLKCLGYENDDEVLFYYQIPLKSLDTGLKPLVSESDISNFLGYVNKHNIMYVYVELVETTEGTSDEDGEGDSENDSESGDGNSNANDIVDEEHLVDKVEVNMSTFKFQLDEEGEAEFIDPIQPHVTVTKDDLEKILAKERIRDYSVESMRNLDFKRNDKRIIWVICKGVVPTLTSKNEYVDKLKVRKRTFLERGMVSAIAKLIPSAEHRFYARHINENMNLTWKGGDYKKMLWRCATSTTIVRFQKT
nr:transposase, mutator type [Tanacetum cinerariifolium]